MKCVECQRQFTPLLPCGGHIYGRPWCVECLHLKHVPPGCCGIPDDITGEQENAIRALEEAGELCEGQP